MAQLPKCGGSIIGGDQCFVYLDYPASLCSGARSLFEMILCRDVINEMKIVFKNRATPAMEKKKKKKMEGTRQVHARK